MKRLVAILLVLCMTFGISACEKTEYEIFELLPNEFLTGETLDEDGVIKAGTKQYTEEDIQNMNGGEANMVFGNEGYLSFLQGKFSENKVENYEQAIEAIQPMAELLGLSAGSEFFCVYGTRDSQGYTYYTFQQRYGELTIAYTGLKIIIDPEGYTAGLSSSFVPNIGFAEETEDIGAEAAENIVLDTQSSYNLTVYSEATHKMAYSYYGQTVNCYAVYTNNPNADSRDFDMKYYEHFVAFNGEYLACYPVASFGTGNTDATRAEDYFASLTSTDTEFTVTTYDGKTETVTVPVAYNENNDTYYLASVERLMAVGYYSDMAQYGQVTFVESKTGTDWRNNDLLAYDRYIKAYDFYASYGLNSVDGMGTPILICTQMPDDNACYCGIQSGWAYFGASDLNVYSEGMDVVGHEYTHGYTASSLTMHIYSGHTGAINEAFSDIMGNIIEMSYGMTEDTTWAVGENAGGAMRSQSNPALYNQPTAVGDQYYADPEDLEYDNGGVHINNSLLSQMAYKLYAAGLGIEEQADMWMRAIEMLTPRSEYAEVLASLKLSIDITGVDAYYKEFLTEAFMEAGMIEGGR